MLLKYLVPIKYAVVNKKSGQFEVHYKYYLRICFNLNIHLLNKYNKVRKYLEQFRKRKKSTGSRWKISKMRQLIDI